MELRTEIEPDFETAEKLYPDVLKLILTYTDYLDENSDENNAEYQKLERKLHEMTGKDMSKFNLWEWWEEEGAENLAFDISLPDPKQVDEITHAELSEIIRRIKNYEELDENDKNFKSIFYNHTLIGNSYFNKFLALNFSTYDYKLFQRNKDKQGNYFEYSQEELIEMMWNNGNYK